MLICHCNGVTDRAIRSAVRNGAATPADVARRCGAGGGCGGCLGAVRELIHSEAAHRVEGAVASPGTVPAAHA